jgi:serine/threonine protein kinase
MEVQAHSKEEKQQEGWTVNDFQSI